MLGAGGSKPTAGGLAASEGPSLVGGGSGSDLMAGDRLYQDAQRRQEKLFHKQLEKEVLVIPSQ